MLLCPCPSIGRQARSDTSVTPRSRCRWIARRKRACRCCNELWLSRALLCVREGGGLAALIVWMDTRLESFPAIMGPWGHRRCE